MSKIGKQPVILPEGVSAKHDKGELLFHGPKGDLKVNVLPHVSVTLEGNEVKFSKTAESKQAYSNWGTLRSLVANAVMGVKDGFVKELEIEGVGFRASMDGKDLVLNIGYSHPVKVEARAGVTFSFRKKKINKIKIRRKMRVRAKITGTAIRPRLSVFRSNRHIFAQLIDDGAGKTLVSVSSKSLKKETKFSKSMIAEMVGKMMAEKAIEQGITQAVFDK